MGPFGPRLQIPYAFPARIMAHLPYSFQKPMLNTGPCEVLRISLFSVLQVSCRTRPRDDIPDADRKGPKRTEDVDVDDGVNRAS
jgi:hypothetical protein